MLGAYQRPDTPVGCRCNQADTSSCSASVDVVFYIGSWMIFSLQFVFSFKPIFEGVPTVSSAVATMNPERTPLDLVQSVRVFVFRDFLRIVLRRRVVRASGIRCLVSCNHVWPSFVCE